MSATITTSVVTGGTNSHATTAAEVNAVATDFITQGVVGTIGSTSGVAPSTGSFAVNAQATPAMFVDVTAGSAWITATPSGQASQNLRASMTANYTSYAISSNSSGSTKYDWIYLKVDPTKANNPDSAADDPTSLFTSRSSSNSTDNGSPPTYGILLAVVTVANGASSITNANIKDSRSQGFVTNAGDSGVSLTTIRGEIQFDFVASGCVWTADSAGSTLNGSMTVGVVYIAGKRVAVSAVTAHGFTASKDTYIDVDNTGTITYTEVTNNAASPALAANSIRLGIIVTGASSIAASTSINQGQETRVLPIASSVPYAVTDSLGNLICPRDPNRKILGYRQITSDFSLTSSQTTITQVTGLSVPVVVPTGRKIRISVSGECISVATGGDQVNPSIWDGAVNSGTKLTEMIATASNFTNPSFYIVTTPSTASKIYNVGLRNGTAARNVSFNATSSNPSFIAVELV